jgi:hypothetical protein
MPQESIGLSEAIRALRAELSDATAAGHDQDLRFELGPIELEFSLEVEKNLGASGGIKFFVVAASADAAHKQSSSHRIKIQLAPQDRSGATWKVADEGK